MKGNAKGRNWGGLGIKGHRKSLALTPFDTAYMTNSYSILIQESCAIAKMTSRWADKSKHPNSKRNQQNHTSHDSCVLNNNNGRRHARPLVSPLSGSVVGCMGHRMLRYNTGVWQTDGRTQSRRRLIPRYHSVARWKSYLVYRMAHQHRDLELLWKSP